MGRRMWRTWWAVTVFVAAGASCKPPAEPPLDFVSEPSRFNIALYGGGISHFSGEAYLNTSALAPGGRYLVLSAPANRFGITMYADDINGLPYDWTVGSFTLDTASAARPVEAPVSLLDASGQPQSQYRAVSGSFEVLESTPDKLLGTFSIEAKSILGFGGTIRMRGSFWATPAP